jgi:phosphatidate cytidylyltransferase
MVTGTDPARGQAPPGAGTARRDLALRVGSAVVLAPLALAAAYAGGWPFVLFWALAAIGIWWEWTTLVQRSGSHGPLIAGGCALTLALLYAGFGRVGPALLVIAFGALAAGLLSAQRRAWMAAGVFYAGVALIGPVLLRADAAWGFVAVLMLFAIVWATDIFGYFAGRLIGGPKLWPQVSPNKTWSGAVAGATAAVLAAVLVAQAGGAGRLLPVAVLALVLSAVSQAGDLLESAIKRRFGAKDAGHLIPGHGGLMDRLDGFLLAAAAAALFGVLRGGLDAPARGLMAW